MGFPISPKTRILHIGDVEKDEGVCSQKSNREGLFGSALNEFGGGWLKEEQMPAWTSSLGCKCMQETHRSAAARI